MMQRLLRRPALQGIGTIAFVNGFSQGAFPVTIVLFAIEHMHMTSSAVGGMLTATVLAIFFIPLFYVAVRKLSGVPLDGKKKGKE